jgi:predicted phosphodiesterase
VKLLLLSDLHLELTDPALPQALDFDVALLAGDIVSPGRRLRDWVAACPALRRARAVVAVCGNHEYFDAVLQHEARAMRSAAALRQGPALHLLDCTQARIGGVRFLGCTLWTDFALRIDTPQGPRSDAARGIAVAWQAMADYRAIGWLDERTGIARRLTPQDTHRLHRQQRAWLMQRLAEPCDGPTVVLTHHGPHRQSLAPRFAADWVSTAYLSELPKSFFRVPALWLHGHTHTSHDYRVGDCRIVCNPRGYQTAVMPRPENAGFRPDLVVTI